MLNGHSRKLTTTLVVWDTQTGVAIGSTELGGHGKIVFYPDQRSITLISQDQCYVWNVLGNTQQYQYNILLSNLGAYWNYKNTLHLATGPGANTEPSIDVYKLQPTSTPPLSVSSSFPIPPHSGMFSFSPVSYHASFATRSGYCTPYPAFKTPAAGRH